MEEVLYPWQEECLKLWLANSGRGIVQAVTGSGKTRLALAAADRLERQLQKDLQVKIVVPTTSLMQQWNRALKALLGPGAVSCGLIGLQGGGQKTRTDCKYMIYVINSARYGLARRILSELDKGESVLLIADECHHYAGSENQLIFEFLPYIKDFEAQFFSMGLTATLPSGRTREVLTQALGRCIYRYGIKNALAAQTVCRYHVFHIEISLTKEEQAEYEELTERIRFLYSKLVKQRPELKLGRKRDFYEALRMLAGDKKSREGKNALQYMMLAFKRKELVCLAKARVQCAVSLIRMLGTKDKIIVFAERIAQVEQLYEALQKNFGARAGRYHSRMGETANKNTLDRFRNGEIRILLACKSMDEGIDVPDASVGIILSGTSAQRQRTQRLGRVIRNAEGKDSASLYYLHAAETSEDVCFLPGGEENELFEIEYLWETDEFLHKSYDWAAEAVYEEMCEKSRCPDVKREITRCLYQGSIHPDWRLPDEEIEKRIGQAGNVREKNYWICMRKVHKSIEEGNGYGE